MSAYDRARLETAFPELDIKIYEKIDSTNSEAKRIAAVWAEEGFEHTKPALLIANMQENGRGRLGRTFYSPEDTGVYMTLLWPSDAAYETAVRITAKTASAVCTGLCEVTSLPLSIKWVNDIYLGGRKIAGILVESVAAEERVRALVIGIGINVSTGDWPAELQGIAASLTGGMAADSEILPVPDRTEIVIRVIRQLIREVSDLGDISYLDVYRNRSCVLGETVDYTKNGVTKTGEAVAIDDHGALIVETADGREVLDSGEVTVRVKRS